MKALSGAWASVKHLGAVVAGLVAGICLGLFVGKSGSLELSKDVSTGNVLQALGTFTSAVLVTTYLQRASSARAESKKWLLG